MPSVPRFFAQHRRHHRRSSKTEMHFLEMRQILNAEGLSELLYRRTTLLSQDLPAFNDSPRIPLRRSPRLDTYPSSATDIIFGESDISGISPIISRDHSHVNQASGVQAAAPPRATPFSRGKKFCPSPAVTSGKRREIGAKSERASPPPSSFPSFLGNHGSKHGTKGGRRRRRHVSQPTTATSSFLNILSHLART